MKSIINNGGNSELLQLKIWFDATFEKGTIVSVQVGTRAALIHNDYEPFSKIYFYDITSKASLPVLRVAYNSMKIPLDLSQYEQEKTNTIGNEEVILHFVYKLLGSVKSLPQKYYAIKEEDDRFTRGRGLQNLIRGESQFVALFERNDEIQQIKAAEEQQQKVEKDLSLQIIKIKRQKIDYKIIFVVIVFFVCLGVMFQRIQNNQFVFYENSPIKRRLQKKKQTKRGRERIKGSKQVNK